MEDTPWRASECVLPTRAPKLVLRAPAPHCCAHHPEAGRPAIPTEGKKLVPVQAPSLSLRAALSPSPSSEEQRDGDPHSALWGLRAEAGASTVTAPTPGKGRDQGKCSPSCSSLEAHNPGGSVPVNSTAGLPSPTLRALGQQEPWTIPSDTPSPRWGNGPSWQLARPGSEPSSSGRLGPAGRR